jgi:hypothetical protein
MKKITISFCIFLAAFSLSSCKKSNSGTPINNYTVPVTYNFSNVTYSDQTILMAMADQLVAKINTANSTPNTPITVTTLDNLFTNTGSPFNDSALNLNGSGLSLSNYCSTAQRTDILNYLDSVSVYSQSATAASIGVAGVSASSASPNKKYLLSPNGVFYSQVVKKTIMGVFAYQIANVYMANLINSTTDTVALAHYWDAAFGFFGVPVNFPTNVTGLKYFGSYCNQVNAGLNSNASIMNAFLKGRAAISNNDLPTMKVQATILIAAFDSLDAAAIVQEMHETETNMAASSGSDLVASYSTLSESIGFVRNLQYNTGKRVITDAQITQLLALYDNTTPATPNLYNFVNILGTQTPGPASNTEIIAQFIGNIYGFNSTELALL